MSVALDDIDNPFWTHVRKGIDDGLFRYIEPPHDMVLAETGGATLLRGLRLQYSRVLSDPRLIDWLLSVCGRRIVEIDTELGYWSYLLGQRGRDTIAFHTRGMPLSRTASKRFVPIRSIDRKRRTLAAGEFETATLLAMESEPPKILTALRAFQGPRFVMVGSHPVVGGELDKLLGEQWQLIAGPVRTTSIMGSAGHGYYFRRKGFRGEARPAWQADTTPIPLLMVPEWGAT